MPGLLVLLSKEFLRLILVACIIAIPAGYAVIHRWLQNFAYRIGLDMGIVLTAVAFSLLIAVITISYHSLRAAHINPSDSLRYE